MRQGRRRGRYRPVCNAGWRRWPNPVSAKRVALPAVAVKSDCINSNNTFVRNVSGVVPIGFGLGCGEKPGVDGGAEREGEEEGRSGEAGDFSADREDDLLGHGRSFGWRGAGASGEKNERRSRRPLLDIARRSRGMGHESRNIQ